MISNFWQSQERKQYLTSLGKEVREYAKDRAFAMVVIDHTTGGYSTWDIPRGPLGEGRSELMQTIIHEAKQDRCLALYFSPVKMIDLGKNSPRNIHCEATRIIDLTHSEEEILAQMKQKGRYNIKVAEKNGVTVKESKDIDAFYKLVKQTGKRDGFTSLPKKKYQMFLENTPGAFLLLAYDKQTEPIAGVLSVLWNKRGIYYYGASNHAERAKMAPYLLQWESMRYCKAKGCTEYDLLGIAPPNSGSDHPWAGISRFKEKFGGEVVFYPQERVIILSPMLYWLLQWKRKLFG